MGALSLRGRIAVLRGVGRTGHEPAVCRLIGHELIVEDGGIPHDGIGMGEEFPVSGVEVMLPQVPAHPSASAHPETRGSVCRSGNAPDVGVVVEYPSVHAVHYPGRLLAALVQFVYHLEQRLSEVGQVAGLGEPVVHLEIDVGRVLGVPDRCERIVPDALQVGRFAAGLGAADEKVAPVIEIGRDEVLVPGVREVGDAHIGVASVGRAPKVEGDAVHVVLEDLDMVFPGLLIALFDCGVQVFSGPGGRVGADVFPVDEIGGDGGVDGGCVGVFHRNHASVRGRLLSAFEEDTGPALELDFSVHAFVVVAPSDEDHVAAVHYRLGSGISAPRLLS